MAGVEFDPAPPERLEACLRPNAQLEAEVEAEAQSYFRGIRLHIVGGKVDEHIVGKVVSRLGFASKDVSWIPCEKSKPPRDLNKRWRDLSLGRDITVCITGRVGHATSGVAAVAARKAGVPHLLVEFPADIPDALLAYSVSVGLTDASGEGSD